MILHSDSSERLWTPGRATWSICKSVSQVVLALAQRLPFLVHWTETKGVRISLRVSVAIVSWLERQIETSVVCTSPPVPRNSGPHCVPSPNT